MKKDIKWKIWLVVGILLISIVVNGMVGYMLDKRNISRLDDISDSEFPAAQNSSLAFECFKSQLRLYEDAVMTGEWNLLDKAWNEQEKIEKIFKAILSDQKIIPEIKDNISSLLNDFLEFSIAADYVYKMMDETSPEKLAKAEKMTPELSKRTNILLERFTAISEQMAENLHEKIDRINADTRNLNFILMIFSCG
ncbi:MAG: hypothetical protein MJB14_16620, partial [Spirochaetes bacterium]|nr:hypothetical protein [Spirochaetota bacterium]